MIICKSKVLITEIGGKTHNDLELDVIRKSIPENFDGGDFEQEVIIYERVNGDKVPRNLEFFKNESFYEYLNSLYEQHLKYDFNVDMQFVYRIFKEQTALDYIDIDRDSESIEITDKAENCTFRIETYELNPERIMKRITRVDSLADLSDEIFSKELSDFISKKVLKRLQYVDGIHSISVRRHKDSTVELNRINNHKIGKIYLEDTDRFFKYDDVQGMKIAYTKGTCLKKKEPLTRMKYVSFIEDFECGKDMLIILDKANYSLSEVMKIFSFRVLVSFGNLVVGITDYNSVEYLDW